MPDVIERLAALGADDLPPASEQAVAHDVSRGRRAVRSRRHRRAGLAAAGTLVIVAAGSLGYVVADSGPSSTPGASLAGPTSTSRHTTNSPSTSGSSGTGIRLVAYHGEQKPGYTVNFVPEGYVLQGISASVLDVSRAGDTSPLDSFAGKLVVMLNDFPANTAGEQVSVNGSPGYIRDAGGATVLSYTDGQYNVAIQSWDNIHLTHEQLVQFADGITVTDDAEVGHG